MPQAILASGYHEEAQKGRAQGELVALDGGARVIGATGSGEDFAVATIHRLFLSSNYHIYIFSAPLTFIM